MTRIFIGRVNFILNSVVPINGGKKEKKKKKTALFTKVLKMIIHRGSKQK